MLNNETLGKILEYQELDRELIKLEKELAGSEAKKTVNTMVQYVKDAQNKSVTLENEAKDLMADYDNLNKAFEENFKKAQILSKKEVESLSEEDLKVFLSQTNAINNNLSIIERKLYSQSQKIEEILKNFEDTRNGIMKARKLHSESKEAYQKISEEKEPEIAKFKKQLESKEKGIDKKIMEKYKSMRQDRIFPIFVPINNTSCGACGMQIPSFKLTTLKTEGFMDCEYCRRLIYSK